MDAFDEGNFGLGSLLLTLKFILADAAVEAFKEALKALPQDQQVTTLLTKYAEVIEENKNLQTSCRTFEKTAQQALKDKEKIELEHSKTVLTRSRLESLCRELQRQNKVIKDENIVRLKEEEDRRKEVSSQFNSTLSEISHLMEENTQNNSKLREENKKMASRLQDLVKQHEQREDHVEKILKQREIETQLAEAKLAKLQIEVKEQKEKMLIDRKGLLEELSILQDKLREKALTEISLRTQLNSYTEKFEEFQGTLDKSNQVFNGFKKEIEQMSKTIRTLEKETKTWKEKFENANVALCQMFNERTKMEANLESQKKQNLQLQSLCRALQKQTRELRSQLKAQGIEEKSAASLEEVSNVSTVEEENNTPVQLGENKRRPKRR
ncbi:Alpha-taxilin [Armadillidium vulgare]|nr:Alpha-taxilin [Armadillidium vulgare]